MANVIPPINASGIWAVSAPFNTLVGATTSYECVSVRRLSDIIAKGEEPFSAYYTPYGIDKAKFDADQAAGVCIVTLMAGNGNTIQVPSSYILAYPSTAGKVYVSMILGVDLGAIPEDMDLDNVIESIKNVVRDMVGIDSNIIRQQVAEKEQVDPATAASYEAARQAKITNSTTDRARRIAAEASLATAQSKILELETYIRNHH